MFQSLKYNLTFPIVFKTVFFLLLNDLKTLPHCCTGPLKYYIKRI